MSTGIDPITKSVIEHRLTSIIGQMGEAMLRTTYSQILNASRDFSIAICDATGRLVAQADHLPVHVGALPWAATAVEERFGADLKPGDVVLLNDPAFGGSHLPDITAFVPVFHEGKRLLWTIVRAHVSDIGGATHGGYNPTAREIWQEGLRIPPIRLHESGRLRDDLLDLIALNVRNGDDFRGDVAAMVGAAHFGERRLNELLGEFGTGIVERAINELLDAAEQQACATVSEWKDGVFVGEALLEDDGHGRKDIRIVAKVTVSCGSVEVDLSDSDPQTVSFVNSSHANMQAAVTMAYAYLLDPETPKNSGSFRPLKVVARPGTIVWADAHLPVSFCTSHPSNEIVEAVIKALAFSCPERAMAGWSRRFRIAIQGEDPRNGRRFIWHLAHARPGGGASSSGDGWSSVGEWHTAGGAKFGSVEVAEARFPLFFRKHEFRPGSGGAGQFRGGLGVHLQLLLETEKPALANTAGEGARFGGCGLFGGEDGAPHDYVHVTNAGERRRLATKAAGIEIAPRDLLDIASSGGGGWGDPRMRTAQEIASDLKNEVIAQDISTEDWR